MHLLEFVEFWFENCLQYFSNKSTWKIYYEFFFFEHLNLTSNDDICLSVYFLYLLWFTFREINRRFQCLKKLHQLLRKLQSKWSTTSAVQWLGNMGKFSPLYLFMDSFLRGKSKLIVMKKYSIKSCGCLFIRDGTLRKDLCD